MSTFLLPCCAAGASGVGQQKADRGFSLVALTRDFNIIPFNGGAEPNKKQPRCARLFSIVIDQGLEP